MKIDAVIPVYKPDSSIKTLILRLKRQILPLSRIIIMNTVSDTDVRALIGDEERVEIHDLEKSEFDHGGTRDRGARLSDADYILYLTQDAMPADIHLTERLHAAFSDSRVKAAYGRQLPKKDCRLLERYTRAFNYPEESRVKTAENLDELGIKTFFCSNVCAMYERKTYIELGGFIRKTVFNEDMIYAAGLIKEGFAVAYAADARVYHSHNYTGLQQFHRNFDLAVSQADHPEVFGGVKSEGEGIKLVKETAAHCASAGKPWLIISLVYQSGCKYAGYLLGKHYKLLPKAVIRFCTMNEAYWTDEI